MYVTSGACFVFVWFAPLLLAALLGLVQAVVFFKCIVPRAQRLATPESWPARDWALSVRDMDVLRPRFFLRALEDQKLPKSLFVAVVLVSVVPVAVSVWITRHELF